MKILHVEIFDCFCCLFIHIAQNGVKRVFWRFGGSLCVAVGKWGALLFYCEGGFVRSHKCVHIFALYHGIRCGRMGRSGAAPHPPTPTFSGFLRLTAPSAPSRKSSTVGETFSSARVRSSTFYNGHAFHQSVWGPIERVRPTLNKGAHRYARRKCARVATIASARPLIRYRARSTYGTLTLF